MPNQRKAGKGLVGFFATTEEAAKLKQAAASCDMNLSEYLRWVATHAPRPQGMKKVTNPTPLKVKASRRQMKKRKD